MPLVSTITEDDDNHSLSSSTNSDDEMDESYCHTHRSCSRYGSCNGKKHEHSSIDSTTSINLSNNSRPFKGETRSADNQSNHRQKYDGTKWRRICSIPGCLLYLNGGIYYKNWLCRKHYVLSIRTDLSSESDNSIIEKTKTKISMKKKSRRSYPQQSDKTLEHHKRGDITINTDGIRQKFDGRTWRPACTYDNCTSFLVIRGYCHRHDVETRKNQSEITCLSAKAPPQPRSKKTRTVVSSTIKPTKGDIQCVRQQWNGTKWYSLCQHYARDCTRRSWGIKYQYLCDAHYKEYQKNQKLSSSKNKRKKLTNDDIIVADERPTAISSQSEQYAQTDVTYPIDSVDLRQGCILIEDDQYECESPQLMVYIKKEEDFLINKRKLAMGVNSLPINCKLELTKIEI